MGILPNSLNEEDDEKEVFRRGFRAVAALNNKKPQSSLGDKFGGLADKAGILPMFIHRISQRMHDQEKSYSPSLKNVGGYSYKPPREEATNLYRYEAPGEHIYNPDVECREDYVPPEPPKQPDRQQGNPNNYKIINGQRCLLFPDGTWRNSKGQICR